MNAFSDLAPVAVWTVLHAWRAEPYRVHRAPQAGYYAVGRGPSIYHRQGQVLAPELRPIKPLRRQ